MDKLLMNQFKKILSLKMRAFGYTDEQRTRILGRITDGAILAWLKKYGPYVLGIILKVMPLIVQTEAPKGQSDPKLDRWVNDEFNEENRLNKPFDAVEALKVVQGQAPPADDKKGKKKDDKTPPPKPVRSETPTPPPPKPRR